MKKLLLTLASLLLFCAVAVAQYGANTSDTLTGLGNQPFSNVNEEIALDSLNIHLDIPLSSASGIDQDFNFAFHYNSNFWYPTATSACGTNTHSVSFCWYPQTNNFGWMPDAAQTVGMYVVQSTICQDGSGAFHFGLEYSNYIDPSGNSHPLPPNTHAPNSTTKPGYGAPWTIWQETASGGSCNSADYVLPMQTSVVLPSIDGSGYTYNLAYPKGAETFYVPDVSWGYINLWQPGNGTPTVTDQRGNVSTPAFMYPDSLYGVSTHYAGATSFTNLSSTTPNNNHTSQLFYTTANYPTAVAGTIGFNSQLGHTQMIIGNAPISFPVPAPNQVAYSQIFDYYSPEGIGGPCGANANASPEIYQYQTSNGPVNATLTCTKYTIQTGFAFPTPPSPAALAVFDFPWSETYNLANPPPYQTYLPTTLAYGDGSTTKFTYESQVAGTVTGRIASVTGRDGAVTSYTYTGSNKGTFFDGTVSGLTKTTPTGTWTYTRAETMLGVSQFYNNPLDVASSVTTVVDPTGNTSVYQYLNEQAILVPYNNTTWWSTGTISNLEPFLVSVQEYQGAAVPANLVKTTYLCYNLDQLTATGLPSACGNTSFLQNSTGIFWGVAAPQMPHQIDTFTNWSGMPSNVFNRQSKTLDTRGNVTSQRSYDFKSY